MKQHSANPIRRQSQRLLAGFVAVSLVGLVAYLGTHHSHTSSAATDDSTYRILKVSAAENEAGGNPTTTQMQDQAKHFNLIVDNATSKYDTAQMHSWASAAGNTNGGDVKMLVYINGSHIKGCSVIQTMGDRPARTANGNYIHAKAQPEDFNPGDNYLMDITKPSWQADRADLSRSLTTTDGWDGVWYDVLGPSPISAGYNQATSPDCSNTDIADVAAPYNSATGKVYTNAEWYQGGKAVMTATRAAIAADKLIGFNGARPGGATAALWQAATIGMDENWLMAVNAPNDWPTLADWQTGVTMLTDAAAAGKSLQAYTQMNGTTTHPVTDAQRTQIHKYLLGSFLLGTDGNQYFDFKYDDGPTMWHPYWDRLLIGHPLTSATVDYKNVGNVYYRQFTRGIVIVNPDSVDHTAVAIPGLAGNYTDIDGSAVSFGSSIDMPAHTAQILIADTATPSSDTQAPSVSLVLPNDGGYIRAGTTMHVEATASDDVGVTKVEFYAGSQLLGTDTTPPYQATFDYPSDAPQTPRTLTAKAYDAAGHVTTTAAIHILIVAATDKGNADINNDGRINTLDLSTLLTHDGQTYQPADLDFSGTVDGGDFPIMNSRWTW